MSELIYLRPLRIEDAETSYKWRNDNKVWTYTGFVPTQTITSQIEKEWLARVLQNENQKRFGICIIDTDQYIGNVQLINIENKSAEFELFIGEKDFWGKGIGFSATKKMLEIAFTELDLTSVYLHVHPDNIIAIRCYYRAGFVFSSQDKNIKMIATLATFSKTLA